MKKLLVLTLVIALLLASCSTPAVTPNSENIYWIYIGLVDKDTGAFLDVEDSKNQVIEQLLADGYSYSIFEVDGAYTSDDGKMVPNKSIAVKITGSDKYIKGLIESFRSLLNVESVYCEAYAASYGIYGGKVANK